MLDCLAETNKFLVRKWFGPPAVVDALGNDSSDSNSAAYASSTMLSCYG